MHKFKKSLLVIITLALAAGVFAWGLDSGTAAADDTLTKLLKAYNYPAQIGEWKARLDRGQLVFGLPSQVPGNDWKQTSTSWEKDNGINLGHPNQEPRYLGYTFQGDLITNDWFPDDYKAVVPSVRKMISNPWKKQLAKSNPKLSPYTWGIICAALENYHERIGYPGEGNSFTNNPGLKPDFAARVREHFKVLVVPQPGMTGTVRHWHNKDGGTRYDTITVRWDILPDFAVLDIDPGIPEGEKAKPGQTYTGTLKLSAKPDASFQSDPKTGEIFSALDWDIKLTKDYSAPVAITAGNSTAVINAPAAAGQGVYLFKTPADNESYTVEYPFQWQVPEGYTSDKLTLTAAVNRPQSGMPASIWNLMEWSEITNTNNVKQINVPVEPAQLNNLKVYITGHTEAWAGSNVTVYAQAINESGKLLTTDLVWKVGGKVVSTNNKFDITKNGASSVTFTMPSTATKVEVYINPNKNRPANEKTWNDNAGGITITPKTLPPPKKGDISVKINAPEAFYGVRDKSGYRFDYTVKVKYNWKRPQGYTGPPPEKKVTLSTVCKGITANYSFSYRQPVDIKEVQTTGSKTFTIKGGETKTYTFTSPYVYSFNYDQTVTITANLSTGASDSAKVFVPGQWGELDLDLIQ